MAWIPACAGMTTFYEIVNSDPVWIKNRDFPLKSPLKYL